MKRFISLAVAVSSLLIVSNSNAAPRFFDPSDGACDPYNGFAGVVCLRAHGTSDYIDRINALIEDNDNASWWTLWSLDSAERRLENLKDRFLNLTGEQVPGLDGCPFTLTLDVSSSSTTVVAEVNVCYAFDRYSDFTEALIVCEDVFCPSEPSPYQFIRGVFSPGGCADIAWEGSPFDSCTDQPIENGALTFDQFNACAVEFGCEQTVQTIPQ